ncbi:YkgJ family cysteine cluster protein [Mucisphaera sp.]|uniref:YkgJ family cysteine cluster protein n=1 Tax=Mucisphaera sp. TaxID=2913024 RepID=UPI003D115C61
MTQPADPNTQQQDWYEPGLEFTCTQCGNCCTGPTGFVWHTPEEAQAIADHLGITLEQFKTDYAEKRHGRWSLKETKRGHLHDCIFLTWNENHTKAGCSIYQVRPTQCRTWPFWPSNLRSPEAWDNSAERCPGMKQGGKFVPADQIRIQRDRSDPRL